MNGKEQSTVSQNFAKFVEHLKNSGQIVSYARFAKSINYSPQSLNEILKGRRDVTIEVLRQFFLHYQVNPIDVFDTQQRLLGNTLSLPGENLKKDLATARLIESRLTLEWIKNYNQQQFYDQLPQFQIPLLTKEKEKLYCYQYNEDTMEPTLMFNDWLIIQHQENIESLIPHRLYVILCSYGLLIRRLSAVTKDHTALLLGNDDGNIIKQKVKLSDVLTVFEIKAKISKTISYQKPHGSPKTINSSFYNE